MTKVNSEPSKKETSSSPLPIAPRTLCFDKEDFTKENFSVDNFVADCRKRVRLEVLRQDLEIYFKLLKNAMIELINKDYADFVNLSTNLVGMDKAIGQLRQPLKTIKENVTAVESNIKTKLLEVETALTQQRKLTAKRKLLGHMLGLLKATEKIEHIQRSEEAKNGQALERIAGEFNQLQYHATFCQGLPVLIEIRERVTDITSKLQASLENELIHGLHIGDAKQVHRCLNSYALISKIPDAENLVRLHVVEPFIKQILEEYHEAGHTNDFGKLFNRLLELVPTQLSLLCDVTSGRMNNIDEQYRGIPGYDFVVNCAWPQIISSLSSNVPHLFSSPDPNIFHKRYHMCMEFVLNFEKQCGSQVSIKRLRQSQSFMTLMSQWSLPVYFQVRFQELGGKFEQALCNPVKDSPVDDCKYRLQSTAVLWQSIKGCWNPDIIITALMHQFWKLTLQLLSRFSTWIKQIHDYQVICKTAPEDFKELTLNQLASLIVDIDTLLFDVNVIYQEEIEPRALKLGLKNTSTLKNAVDETLNVLRQHKEAFIDYIIKTLTSAAIPHLKQTQDVPRLFRKTNRPTPTEPSAYLVSVVNPAVSFRSEQSSYVDSDLLKDWLTKFTISLCEKYYTAVCDVLTSVRKMEESMMRLQKLRSGKFSSGNLTSLTGVSDTLSDDEKIRLQLYLDVVSFGKQMSYCNVNMEEIEKYQLLLKTVNEAKNKTSMT